jgi:hypothetical protein
LGQSFVGVREWSLATMTTFLIEDIAEAGIRYRRSASAKD